MITGPEDDGNYIGGFIAILGVISMVYFGCFYEIKRTITVKCISSYYGGYKYEYTTDLGAEIPENCEASEPYNWRHEYNENS